MSSLAEAVIANAPPQELLRHELPSTYTAAHLLRRDQEIFKGVTDKDVRKSLHVGQVPMPELAPDEVLVAVMASAINYNTVWSATFEPLPTFQFLDAYAREDNWGRRHAQPFHVLGSDGAGVVVRTGSLVRHWSVGDKVVINPVHIDEQEPIAQHDGMLGNGQRAWGFETNFGGLANFTVVKATQLLPKAPHLTWEEAACNPLCLGTAYRMLVGERGARMKQGDVVLIWGATGGLGAYAVQLVRNGGGIPVGVVSGDDKKELLKKLGCDVIIDRREIGLSETDTASWRRLGKAIRTAVGEDPNIVFEYVGRQTFGASVFVVRRGGCVITCGSSTGYVHEYDNRYLWMRLKRIIGSHGANSHDAMEANRLLSMGRIHPTLSRVFPLEEVGEAVRSVQLNAHLGKVGVLCLAPREGLGVDDPALRAKVGERNLTLFRERREPVGGHA
jgi:crotonyl-CoA reductase